MVLSFIINTEVEILKTGKIDMKKLGKVFSYIFGLIIGVTIIMVVKVGGKTWLILFISLLGILQATIFLNTCLKTKNSQKGEDEVSNGFYIKLQYISILTFGSLIMISYKILLEYINLNQYISKSFLVLVILLFLFLSVFSSIKGETPTAPISYESVRCPYCGSLLRVDDIDTLVIECPHCGKKLKL